MSNILPLFSSSVPNSNNINTATAQTVHGFGTKQTISTATAAATATATTTRAVQRFDGSNNENNRNSHIVFVKVTIRTATKTAIRTF